MSGDSSVDIGAHFRTAVSVLSTADEPWIGLQLLCGASSSISVSAHASSQSGGKGGLSQAERAEDALQKLSEVSELVYQWGLLSKNETLDDVATSTLKYLLLPYLLSRAHLSWHGEEGTRLWHIEKAQRSMQDFFRQLDALGMVSAEERVQMKIGDDEEVDAVLDVRRKSQSAMEKRQEKIARFKAERAAERVLSQLIERRRVRESNEDDEEVEREGALTLLQSAKRKCIDAQDNLETEMQLLRYAQRERSRGNDPRVRAEKEKERAPKSVIEGMPPTFKIVNQREEIRNRVFKPDHSLPTYTVEEWGEIERQMMEKKMKEKEKEEIVRVKKREEEDSDADDAVDRETLKQREWDDWKDEHNKGSGNTMR